MLAVFGPNPADSGPILAEPTGVESKQSSVEAGRYRPKFGREVGSVLGVSKPISAVPIVFVGFSDDLPLLDLFTYYCPENGFGNHKPKKCRSLVASRPIFCEPKTTPLQTIAVLGATNMSLLCESWSFWESVRHCLARRLTCTYFPTFACHGDTNVHQSS